MKLSGILMISGTIGAFILMGCNNRSTHTLCYYETQCADPWNHGSNDTIHEANIVQFLSNHGVNPTDVDLETDQDSMMVCLACQCLSGVKITIEVNSTDTAAAHALGFH